jgi:hypothetical protein
MGLPLSKAKVPTLSLSRRNGKRATHKPGDSSSHHTSAERRIQSDASTTSIPPVMFNALRLAYPLRKLTIDRPPGASEQLSESLVP